MPIPQLTKSPRTWKKNRFNEKHQKIAKVAGFFKKGDKNRWKSLLKIGLVAGIICLFLGFIGLIGVVAWFSRDLPDPNTIIDRSVAQSTKIYDRTGETVLYEIYGDQSRTLIQLEELPDHVKWATIVIEDKDFYKHHGISLWAIFRTAVTNFLRKESAGGSTLTQQFVKNAVLTPEKSYIRKIKEAILSYRIENRFTKDEILQMYLNEIPYGSTAYGVEAASQRFLGKSAKDLSISEAAILAALPQRPSYYSPYGNHVDELFLRQKRIINLLVDRGHITEEQGEKAKSEEIVFSQKREDIIAPHFVMYVKELLNQEFSETEIEQGGLKIITTLDLYKQKIAEEAVKEGAEKNQPLGASNAALVSLNPINGEIMAMVGSKDYWSKEIDGNVNVTLRPRQPGSSFKPIAYAASFEKGYTPETVLFDVETIFKTDTKDYLPRNFNLKEQGPVTIREALAGSLNIPAVKTIYLTGIEQVIDLAEKMGYTTFRDRSRFGLSLVLGGGEIKLLEHAAAFGVFAREGIYNSPIAILKIKDRNGKTIKEYQSKEQKGVLSQKACQQINSILSDDQARAYIFGTGGNLTLGNRPVAAKTGTTNDNRDGWAVGYTPSIVTGVWAGNNDNGRMSSSASGYGVASHIWNNYMNKVLGDTPHESFKQPPPNDAEKPVLRGDKGVEVALKIDKITGKIATDLTPPELVEEKTFKEVHSILHYVDKNNPRGPAPENPEKDINYLTWEEGIKKWAEKNDYLIEAPPVPDDEPGQNTFRISITYPKDKATVTEKTIIIQISNDSGVELDRVTYYLDGQERQTVYLDPFEYLLDTTSLVNGWHSLRAIAFDNESNYGYGQIDFNLLLSADLPSLSWSSPRENSKYYQSNFPLILSGYLENINNLESVGVYLIDINNNKALLEELPSPQSSSLQVSWETPPEQGFYQIYAELKTKNGQAIESRRLKIEIE